MHEWIDQHVLITQSALFSIAGSEVVTFELAEFFSRNGATVTVVCYGFSNDWHDQFATLPSTKLLRIDDPVLPELIAMNPPDYAWIHHQVIPEALLRNPGQATFIFHHMSAFLPQEFPVEHHVEAALASLVLFPAQETLDAQRSSGLLERVPRDSLAVFGNPAPERFWVERPRSRTHLKRILVVTNHLPKDLADALDLLAPTHEVIRRGEQQELGAVSRLISPAELDDADAIISIGKTVQYALASGVPVFCYDHFGGPGWLSETNFEAARAKNFSGRGFTQRGPTEIAQELLSGFPTAVDDSAILHGSIAADFLLRNALERVLASSTPRPAARLDKSEVAALLLRQEISNGLTNAIAARDMTIASVRMTSAHEAGVVALERENSAIALRRERDQLAGQTQELAAAQARLRRIEGHPAVRAVRAVRAVSARLIRRRPPR